MKNRRVGGAQTRSQLVLMVTLASCMAVGCSGDKSGSSYTGAYTQADFSVPDMAGADLVVAEVGGKPITAGFLNHKLRIQFPDMPQEGPSMALQARETLQRVLVEECFNKLGAERGYDRDPEFLRTMYLSRSFVMTNLASTRSIFARTMPSQEEVRAYYEENRERFTIRPQSWFRHIQVANEAEAHALRRRLENGEDFEELAKRHSKDETTAAKGGVMPPMTETYHAGRLGRQPELGAKVMSMALGEISQPIRTDYGWHIVRIDAVRAERERPLEEVVDEIVQKLRSRTQGQLYTAVLDSLKQAYSVSVDEDAMREFFLLQMTDVQLFDEAQSEPDPSEKVFYYSRLLERFPQSAHLPEALFMIGFIRAENLADTTGAREAFQKFVATYPEHEMAGSARLMLGELGAAGSR